MNILPSSPTKESMFINLVNLSLKTIKDVIANIGGKIGELSNQIRGTRAREMILFLMSRAE